MQTRIRRPDCSLPVLGAALDAATAPPPAAEDIEDTEDNEDVERARVEENMARPGTPVDSARDEWLTDRIQRGSEERGGVRGGWRC